MKPKFCPKCNRILIPKRINENLFAVRCVKCDYVDIFEGKPFIGKDKIPQEEERGEGVVKEKNVFATYKNVCPKCGYNKAQVIDVGVFYSDEDNLIMLRCGKCGYSERVGRKTS